MIKSKDEQQLLDVKAINEALKEGRIVAIPADGERKRFETISQPVFCPETGLAKYKLGDWYDDDFWVYTPYMTLAELREYVYFYEMQPRILG